MKVLIIGGTGLISTGIVTHLLRRGADVTVFNRGQRVNTTRAGVSSLHGDRNDFEAFERLFESRTYDVVIDMVCFTPEQASSAVRAFESRCEQLIFCSTVCTYGAKIPPGVVIDETFPQEPISEYGRNKVACEQIFLRADASGAMNVTIIRPSHTYGPGSPLIDNIEFNPVSWDRMEKGQPVLCAGDGLGLWNSTHRDDCAKLFAYAALHPKTFGQAYNATRQHVFTWRDYYRQAGKALGRPARVLFLPAQWIIARDPQRFALLREITQFHGAYTSAKAMNDVPEFRCDIGFSEGAEQTLHDVRARNAWKSSEGDTLYQKLVDDALAVGIEPVTL